MPIRMHIGPKGDFQSLMAPQAFCDHCGKWIEEARCGVCLFTVDTAIDNHSSDLAFVHNPCVKAFKAEYVLPSDDIQWVETDIESTIAMLTTNLAPGDAVDGIPRLI
jgi:hypothetical protein